MSAEPTQRTELARAKHQQALELMDKQQLPGALRLFGEALAQEETCDRWNDWAVAQFTRNQFAEAEQGFRYALELDPANLEVAGNLGVVAGRMRTRARSDSVFGTRCEPGERGRGEPQHGGSAGDDQPRHGGDVACGIREAIA